MHESENLGIIDSEELKNAFVALYVFSFQGSLIYEFAPKAEIGQNGPKFRFLHA